MRTIIKNQAKKVNIFFIFTFLYRKNYILLEYIFRKTLIIYSCGWFLKFCSKTTTPKQRCIGFVAAALQSKILGNRLGILAQTLIAMDYYFFLFFNGSEKYLQFKKLQKHLVEKIFGSPHTSNRIYLPWNYFTNYVYLKDMCITLK